MSREQRIIFGILAADIALNLWIIYDLTLRQKHNGAWDRAMKDEFGRIKKLRAEDLAKMTDEELIDGASSVGD